MEDQKRRPIPLAQLINVLVSYLKIIKPLASSLTRIYERGLNRIL